ncbi:MAG: SprB repeat-containing protein, partial [Saprospiraceae bacterium]
MKKLITFSAFIIGISIVFIAAELPIKWIGAVDETHDGLLFQTNTLPETNSELVDVKTWLTGETAESPSGLSAICVDTAGTITRTLTGGAAAPIIYPLCWGDDYIITHDGNAVFTGDGDPLTQAGVDLMIFTDFPTISGELVADIAMNAGYTGNVVGTDPLGNITLTNLGTYQNFYGTNAQGYTALWFAPVTIDDVTSTPKTLSEDIGGANECVNVSVGEAFQIAFLDSIHIDNITTPTGGNLCQASFDVSGGLMAYNGGTYTITIEETTDPTITGTMSVNPTPMHNSAAAFTVPQPGLYNLNVSDGCTTKTVIVDMTACVSCTDDAGTLTSALSSASNSNNVLYLCSGDTLNLTHDGNQDVAGDPNPTTTPGVQYAMYTCLPTSTGPTLNSDILLDPCLLTTSGGTTPRVAFNVDGNGNGFLSNATAVYQNILTNEGLAATDEIFFAPITVDGINSTPPFFSQWEGVSGPNECTNVNVTEAFSVVFLSPIVVQPPTNISGGNVCRGEIQIAGGLPEANASNYVVTVSLLSNAAITGTIVTPATHNGTAVFEVPQPGNYRIDVTDNIGCVTNSAFVDMTACTSPCSTFLMGGGITSNYNGADISCDGASDGSIVIMPTGGNYPYTYSWSVNVTSTDSIATNLNDDSYSVTVTDADGCTIDTTISLTQPSSVFTGPGFSSPLCSGDSTGMVWAQSLGGGTPPYTFTWSNGVTGTNDTIFNLPAGTYAYTVTDANGCTGQGSTTLGNPPVLNGNFTSVNNATCEGINDGDATIVGTGGTGAYSYTWAHDAALITSTASNLGVGTYYVTITDDNGCSYKDSVAIAATLVVSATSVVTDVNCFGGNDGEVLVTPLTSGGAPNLPYSYSWSPNSTEITNNATGLTVGNYMYTVTDNVGCIYIDSAMVNQPDSLIITNISTTDVLCNGDTTGTITVSAANGAGGYMYDWGNGNTDSTLMNVGAGTYTVTVTDANGCVDSLIITLSQPPA